MASYQIDLRRSAEKDLHRLPDDVVARAVTAIDTLAEDPRPRGVKRLSGPKPRYRIRIGVYRILYAINDENHAVSVYAVKHRREAYRRK